MGSKKYIIDEALLQELLRYLGDRPHREVEVGIRALQGLSAYSEPVTGKKESLDQPEVGSK